MKIIDPTECPSHDILEDCLEVTADWATEQILWGVHFAILEETQWILETLTEGIHRTLYPEVPR